jgi:protein-S-isoprenylcysteine O-methyltransferase Ste14
MTAAANSGNLFRRMVRQGAMGILFATVALFGSAGTLRFWQGWSLLALHSAVGLANCLYFYRRAPEILERRLLKKEKFAEQKIIIALWKFLGAASIVLAGLDHRFGWSRAYINPVPLWLELFSFLLILAGCVLNFNVLKTNAFAASVIQTEAGQPVIASGPYAMIRHPMYLGFALMGVFTPLALGSFIALPAGLLIIPVIIARLLNEERFLRRDLAGYADYCELTRYRLLPFVW